MAKRSVDLALGLAAAIVTLPLVLLLAAVLALELRAWPFFVQERVGRGGELLRVVKLRTLPPSTPTDASKYDLAVVRIPPVAARLRSLHLDELPQLWQVVAGRMSLVGPRPEMPHLHAFFDPETQRARARVRPGCTGLWQVSVAAGGLMHEHPEYDLAYVRSASFRLDVWILWRTAGMLVGRGRTATLDAAPLHPAEHQVLHLPVEIATENRAAI